MREVPERLRLIRRDTVHGFLQRENIRGEIRPAPSAMRRGEILPVDDRGELVRPHDRVGTLRVRGPLHMTQARHLHRRIGDEVLDRPRRAALITGVLLPPPAEHTPVIVHDVRVDRIPDHGVDVPIGVLDDESERVEQHHAMQAPRIIGGEELERAMPGDRSARTSLAHEGALSGCFPHLVQVRGGLVVRIVATHHADFDSARTRSEEEVHARIDDGGEIVERHVVVDAALAGDDAVGVLAVVAVPRVTHLDAALCVLGGDGDRVVSHRSRRPRRA